MLKTIFKHWPWDRAQTFTLLIAIVGIASSWVFAIWQNRRQRKEKARER